MKSETVIDVNWVDTAPRYDETKMILDTNVSFENK